MRTALLVAAVVACTAIAQAQNRVNVRGVIMTMDAGVMTVGTSNGPMRIALADNSVVRLVVPADLSKIKVGTYVGIAAEPQSDGTYRAQETLIFNEALRGAGEGHRPHDLSPQSTMTNATVASVEPHVVDKIDGRMLTLRYKDGEKKIFVPTNVPIVAFAPGDRSLLVAGAKVVMFNVLRREDGAYIASGINVGKDGLMPPM